MRSDWREVPLSEVAELTVGYVGTMSSEYKKNGIKFLRSLNIRPFKIDFSDIKYISDEFHRKLSKSELREGDVVIVRTGQPGASAVIPANCGPMNCSDLVIIHPDKEEIDPLFLAAYINWSSGIINASLVGAVQQHFNVGAAKKMVLALPDIRIQKKISAIIGCINGKIELNNRINENLQAQARTLYKAWFVDYIPFEGTQPNHWKKGKLKDILTLKRNAIKAGENTELPYLPIDVIPMNTFALSDIKPNEEAQSSLITFDKDDIIIGAMRVYFHRVIIAPFAGITRTTCFTLKPSDKDYLCFGLLCCDQDSSIDYAQSTSKGSTMPYAVWDGGLGDMDITIPDKDTAHEFNELVLPMIKAIQASYEENKHLRDIRDNLLPRLMSGKLNVSDIDL